MAKKPLKDQIAKAETQEDKRQRQHRSGGGIEAPKDTKGVFAAALAKSGHNPFHFPNIRSNILPTGITILDSALGGGLPGGTFTMLHGDEGIGKSAFTYHLAGIVQSLGGFVWIDDPSDKFNVDLARINGMLVGPEEDPHGTAMYSQSETAEEFLANLLHWIEFSRGKQVPCLMIHDDLAVTPTKNQATAGVKKGEDYPMDVAKILSSFFRKNSEHLRHLMGSSFHCLIVNQHRAGIDFFNYGPPVPSLPGGKAVRFKLSTRIKMSSQALDQKDKEKGGPLIGKQARFVVEKCCLGPEKRWALCPYFFNFGYDDAISCLRYLIGMGHIRKGTEEGVKLKYCIEGAYHNVAEWRRLYYENQDVRNLLKEMTFRAFQADNTPKGGGEMAALSEVL